MFKDINVRKVDKPMILFSVQDLFGYLKAHATMSGIQRVQAGIAMYTIDNENDDCGFILNDLTDAYNDGEFLLIENDRFQRMIAYASGSRVDHDILREMLADCEANAKVIRPKPEDTIILLGAFWGHGNTLDRYVTAKRDGVRIGAYIYDIIPITHPEYCDAALARDFSMSVGEMALVVDFIFTISDYTRERLGRLFRETGVRTIPMTTVPLAHSLTAEGEGRDSWPASLRKIEGKRYVAYVSTVEGRKNHLYVVNAWQQMIAQGVDVPDLVFVGRRGWRVSGLNDLLDGTHNLDGRVHIVRDLSDAELDSIYSHCLFTVFTSFVEGWGLPVGESLVHHVPCVASNTSSIPEVGGDFVDYIDPLNLRDGIAVFRRMIEDDAYRTARRTAIEQNFVQRTWEDVGRDFLAKTRAAIAVDYPVHPIYPRLRQGVKFMPGDLISEPIQMMDYALCPMRLAMKESFYAIEHRGVWMRGGTGELRFLTELAAGTEIFLYLDCYAAPVPGASPSVLVRTVDGAGTRRWHPLVEGRPNLIRVTGCVGEAGLCTVVIETAGNLTTPSPGDTRSFILGLAAIGYVDAGNQALREDLVERFIFHDMTNR